MQFGTVPLGLPSVVRTVQSADPVDLERRINQALAELAALTVTVGEDELPVFVASMELAGGGDGHTFVVKIVAGPVVTGSFNGLTPGVVSARCFLASEADAVSLANVRSLLGLTDTLVASEFAGAAGGTRFMGLFLTTSDVDELASFVTTTGLYGYAISAIGDAIAVPIAGAGTPVLVPGPFVYSGNPLFQEQATGIVEYLGAKSLGTTIRARVAVRATVAGPVVVRFGVYTPGAPPTPVQTQTISVDNTLFQHVTAEASRTFSPSGVTDVAIAIANETTTDDLEVLSAQLIIEPLQGI